jgi:hypothetical protein
MQNLPPSLGDEARPRFYSSQMQKPPGANLETSARRLSTADTGPAGKSPGRQVSRPASLPAGKSRTRHLD